MSEPHETFYGSESLTGHASEILKLLESGIFRESQGVNSTCSDVQQIHV